jgi:hypothetical protein
MSDEELQRLRKENEALKKSASRTAGVVRLARVCCRASSAGRVGAWLSFEEFVGRGVSSTEVEHLRFPSLWL